MAAIVYHVEILLHWNGIISSIYTKKKEEPKEKRFVLLKYSTTENYPVILVTKILT